MNEKVIRILSLTIAVVAFIVAVLSFLGVLDVIPILKNGNSSENGIIETENAVVITKSFFIFETDNGVKSVILEVNKAVEEGNEQNNAFGDEDGSGTLSILAKDVKIKQLTVGSRVSLAVNDEAKEYTLEYPLALPTSDGQFRSFKTDGSSVFTSIPHTLNASKLQGRGSENGSGIVQEISIGSGLHIADTTLFNSSSIILGANGQFTSMAAGIAAGFSNFTILGTHTEPIGFTLTSSIIVTIGSDSEWKILQSNVGTHGIVCESHCFAIQGFGNCSKLTISHDGGTANTVFLPNATTEVLLQNILVEADDLSVDGFLFAESQSFKTVSVLDCELKVTSNSGTGIFWNIGQTGALSYTITGCTFVGTLPVGTVSNVIMIDGRTNLNTPSNYLFENMLFLGEFASIDLSGNSFNRVLNGCVFDSDRTEITNMDVSGTGFLISNFTSVGIGALNLTVGGGRYENFRLVSNLTIGNSGGSFVNGAFSGTGTSTTISSAAVSKFCQVEWYQPVIITNGTNHVFDGCSFSFADPSFTITSTANDCKFVNCVFPSEIALGATSSRLAFTSCTFTQPQFFDTPEIQVVNCHFSALLSINNASTNTGIKQLYVGNRFTNSVSITNGSFTAAQLPLFTGNNVGNGSGAATGPNSSHANSIGNN